MERVGFRVPGDAGFSDSQTVKFTTVHIPRFVLGCKNVTGYLERVKVLPASVSPELLPIPRGDDVARPRFGRPCGSSGMPDR